jgi:hypothetical protein
MTDTTLAERLARCVKPLRWQDFEGMGAKAQAWLQANYLIQKWSDGRYEISASYPGYSTLIGGTDRFYPTIEAAKIAVENHETARILAALDLGALAREVEAMLGVERETALEAFKEALIRYPEAAGGLVFFWGASGLGAAKITPDMIAWADAAALRAAPVAKREEG